MGADAALRSLRTETGLYFLLREEGASSFATLSLTGLAVH